MTMTHVAAARAHLTATRPEDRLEAVGRLLHAADTDAFEARQAAALAIVGSLTDVTSRSDVSSVRGPEDAPTEAWSAARAAENSAALNQLLSRFRADSASRWAGVSIAAAGVPLGDVDATNLVLERQTIDLRNVTAFNSTIDFSGSQLTSSTINLSGAQLTSSQVSFDQTHLRDSALILRRLLSLDTDLEITVQSDHSEIDLLEARSYGDAVITMSAAELRASRISFKRLVLDGHLSLTNAQLIQTSVDLGFARCSSGAIVNFEGLTAEASTIDLTGADLPHGRVWLDPAFQPTDTFIRNGAPLDPHSDI